MSYIPESAKWYLAKIVVQITVEGDQTQHVTVGERVRRTLREARTTRSVIEPETKLHAVRRAAQYAFPTADIEQMLREIERGYGS